MIAEGKTNYVLAEQRPDDVMQLLKKEFIGKTIIGFTNNREFRPVNEKEREKLHQLLSNQLKITTPFDNFENPTGKSADLHKLKEMREQGKIIPVDN